jgi:hypothetical protein
MRKKDGIPQGREKWERKTEYHKEERNKKDLNKMKEMWKQSEEKTKTETFTRLWDKDKRKKNNLNMREKEKKC